MSLTFIRSGIGGRALHLQSSIGVIFDPARGVSGAYRPIEPSDLANSTGVIFSKSEQGTPSNKQGVRITNDILAGNSNRKNIYIQNLATTALYVSFSGTADPTNFNVILKGDSSQDAGAGGIWDKSYITGAVSCSGARYLMWEVI